MLKYGRLMLRAFSSIKYKYFLLTILSFAIFLTTYTYFWFSQSSIESEKSTVQYISELVRKSNENFDFAMKDVSTLITGIAVNDKIKNILLSDYSSESQYKQNVEEVQQYLMYLFGFRYYMKGLTITNKLKPELSNTSEALPNLDFTYGLTMPTDEIKKNDWYRDVLKSGENAVFIPPHFLSLSSDQNPPGVYTGMAISVTRNMYYGKEYLGTIIADISCEHLVRFFSVNLGNICTTFIYNPKKDEFVLRPPDGEIPSDFNDIEFKKIIRDKSDRGNTRIKLGKKDFLMVYYNSDLTGWTTVGLIPREILLENFNKTKNKALVAAVIFFTISVIISLIIASLLTKNLLRLNKAMNQFGKDGQYISLKIKSNDEVSQLYNQFNLMVIRIRQLIDNIRCTEQEKRKSEIQALQSQINPHFLYNTLNTIRILAVFKGADNIKQVTEALSNLLHVSLDSRSFINIKEEVEYLKSYLSIQEYKYSDKFSWDIYVEDGLEGFMVPKLVLQPLVENALSHGIAPLKTTGLISIKIYNENNLLKIRIRDNGVGMSPEKIEALLQNKTSSRGIGIQNVLLRLKIYFGDSFNLIIMSQENIYTLFELSIPEIPEGDVATYA